MRCCLYHFIYSNSNFQEQYQRLQNMQKKTTTMTTGGGGGEEEGSEEVAADTMEQVGSCNTLPGPGHKEARVNGAKSVKFSTLPSPNKGVFNNHA